MKKIDKVLVTGVAGFIGSNLLDYLIDETNWEIIGYDNFSTGRKTNVEHHIKNKRFKLVEGNILEIKSINEYDCVFHLAALPRIQPSFQYVTEHINENLINSMHLIELMIKEEQYPKFVFSSSSAIYGTPKTIPTPETERIDCLSPYAFQKFEVEKYLELLSTRYPLDYVCLRYFNPYGPRSFNPANQFNAYSSVIGIFLYKVKKNEALLITGDGNQRRDFIHVSDLARANYKAAVNEKRMNTAFNIGRGSTISVLEVAKVISNNYTFIPKREGESEITFADITKAKSELDWEPIYDLQTYLNDQKSD